MIIYNKKMQQGGQASWYNDPNSAGYSGISQGANMVGDAMDQSGNTQYMNTAPTGNMSVSNIEKPDFQKMQKEGQGAGALKGAGTGAATGAAIGSVVPGIGTAIGAVAGGVIGGLSGWLSSRKKGKQRREAGEAQYQADVNQAKSNYAANARNQYAQQYAGYQQQGGTLSADPMANNAMFMKQPVVPQPSMVQQPGTVPVAGQQVPGQQPNPMQQVQPQFKNGGSFGRKVNILMADVSKKA